MTDKKRTIKELKEALNSLDITNKYRLNLIRAIEYLQEEPVSEDLEEELIILTEEILKKNGFRLNPRPLYKYPYWSKLFTASDGREYLCKINMEQQIRETLMTVMPLASNEPSQPTCYLPHPKTIQQLEKSLRLFNIKFVIEV